MMLLHQAELDPTHIRVECGESSRRRLRRSGADRGAEDKEPAESRRCQRSREITFHELQFAPAQPPEQCKEAHPHLIVFSPGKCLQRLPLLEVVYCVDREVRGRCDWHDGYSLFWLSSSPSSTQGSA